MSNTIFHDASGLSFTPLKQTEQQDKLRLLKAFCPNIYILQDSLSPMKSVMFEIFSKEQSKYSPPYFRAQLSIC